MFDCTSFPNYIIIYRFNPLLTNIWVASILPLSHNAAINFLVHDSWWPHVRMSYEWNYRVMSYAHSTLPGAATCLNEVAPLISTPLGCVGSSRLSEFWLVLGVVTHFNICQSGG